MRLEVPQADIENGNMANMANCICLNSFMIFYIDALIVQKFKLVKWILEYFDPI